MEEGARLVARRSECGQCPQCRGIHAVGSVLELACESVRTRSLVMKFRANKVTPADGGWRLLFACVAHWPAAAEFLRYRDVKLHSILFGWSDPDQALRVAAGILGKRASDGLRPSGQYCQGCEAFPTMYRTWEPQSGVGLELEDMVKTN